MVQHDVEHNEPGGPIAFMASNPIAANLLMFGILTAGLVSLMILEREAWPTIPFYMIDVSVAYPGASPEEVEESIVIKIEERVSAIQDIKNVRSVAAPGMGSVVVEVKSGTDMDQALDEIATVVRSIRTFPARAERPIFRELSNRQSMMRLILHGNISDHSLKELAYQIEDELVALPPVSHVDTTGIRDYEISIEVPLNQLRALGLTLDDVAATVRRGSLDLSAGSIETKESEVLVRTVGQRYDQQDFEDIVVLTRTDGTQVRLGDIATVKDGFESSNLLIRHNQQPAVFIEVYRAEGEQVMNVAEAVHAYVSEVIEPTLPQGVGITFWNDESQTYSERAYLLIKNGVLGLILVLIALALFLEIRLAFWVAVGLAVSVVGSLTAMMLLGMAINTISLFVFVLAVGIVVDDAIVVAEHIYEERRRGTDGVTAAIRGVRRIKKPLTFAVLTSVAAFTPVFLVPGGIGEIWRALPVVVIAMLIISLIESFFILPNHLSHLPDPNSKVTGRSERFFVRTQGIVDRSLELFVNGPLHDVLHFSTRHPGVVISGAVAALIVCISFLPSGVVKSTFADVIEGDFVSASLEMPVGTTADKTFAVAKEIEVAGIRVAERLSDDRQDDGIQLLSGTIVTIGQGPRLEGGGITPKENLKPQANIGTVELKLISAQDRDISTVEVAQAWREEVGFLPNVRGIVFSGEVIDLGNPIEVILSHPDPDRLVEIATSVVSSLRRLGGVYDVRSDHAPGVREIQLMMRPEARTLGLTLEELAVQARGAFFGSEALRIQRGREEVAVYLRLPESERNSITDIENFLIRTPQGATVPITAVATLQSEESLPVIRRKDQRRVVTVTAEVDKTVISANRANDVLENSILVELSALHPRLTYEFGGEQEAQAESVGGLTGGFVMVLFAMYAMLAIPLRSYSKPVIVMAIIPFGFIGMILGHLILNVPVSATSFIGFFGLSGIVINDSLVMIDFIDQRLSEGVDKRTAIIEGAKGRFRPIMLTSVTTFLGFTPLIFEQAIQAQFLAPFAATLGIGILITTVILMLVTPAITTIYLRVDNRAESSSLSVDSMAIQQTK